MELGIDLIRKISQNFMSENADSVRLKRVCNANVWAYFDKHASFWQIIFFLHKHRPQELAGHLPTKFLVISDLDTFIN